MKPEVYILCFVVLILANFRIAVFLADDTGPFNLFGKLRSFLTRKARTETIVRKSKVDEGIQCKRCNSVWSGMILAAWVFVHESVPTWIMFVGDALILSFALSAAAILLVRAFPPKG